MPANLKFSPSEKELLKQVFDFSKGKKVKLYLVGGILRDLILGRKKDNPDFDFALKSGAISFGRALAKKMHAGFVALDKEHGACRVVKKRKTGYCTFDFTDFRSPVLEKDILLRDFTVNSLALELEKVFLEKDLSRILIDLYGAQKDLKAKVIKVVSQRSFGDDPLRILRAFSFASLLGFKIEAKTLRLAKKEKDSLKKVSLERIRDELFKIFDCSGTFEYLEALDKLRILTVIFPEIELMRGVYQGPYHHLDIWKHSLETVKQFDGVLSELKNNKPLQEFLDQPVSGDRKRCALIKFAAFLHDIGKPKALRRKDGKLIFHGHEAIGSRMAEEICRRLKLSNDETGALKKIVFCHLRPGYLADTPHPTPRAVFRFFRDADSEALSVLLVSLADQRSTKGRLTTKASHRQHEKVVAKLIKEYFHKKEEKKLPRLVNGDDLIKEFGLEPSPLIGRILSKIEESRAIGRIKSKQDALALAGKIIKPKR